MPLPPNSSIAIGWMTRAGCVVPIHFSTHASCASCCAATVSAARSRRRLLERFQPAGPARLLGREAGVLRLERTRPRAWIVRQLVDEACTRRGPRRASTGQRRARRPTPSARVRARTGRSRPAPGPGHAQTAGPALQRLRAGVVAPPRDEHQRSDLVERRRQIDQRRAARRTCGRSARRRAGSAAARRRPSRRRRARPT